MRYCFLLQVRPDRLAEYRERHRAVWPEMLAALRDTGWHNYSLFLRDDGLLVGYVEAETWRRRRRRWRRTEVNARWQAEMAPFFTGRWRRPTRAGPDEVFLARSTRSSTYDSTEVTTIEHDAARSAGAARASSIETPSWAFGNSGTRFKVFAQAGVPRDPYEKIADAAEVHRFTGVAPSVALHIPWDKVDDYADARRVRRRAGRRGSARSTPTCSRTTTTSSAASPTPTRRSAARRPTTCSSASTSWTPPARAT